MEPEFNLKGSTVIEGLGAVASLYEHNVYGAQFLDYKCEDNNNFFGIVFHTAPETANGVAHALEHMTMQGSKKYPIANLFFEVRKRSINTFLNACTSPQYIAFQIASMNETDFHNLIDIFLDSVFHPLLKQDCFISEVHHTEFSAKSDTNSPLTETGAVYNEMNGVFSSPNSVFYNDIRLTALASTSYNVNSGGEPSSIANLKVEDLVKFHSLYFRPANAHFIHYGSFDTSKIMAHVNTILHTFEPAPIYISPTFHAHITPFQPFLKETSCPIEAGESPDSQIRASITWVAGEITDFNLAFELDLLCHLLMGSGSSPLYLALIKSGIASGFSGVGANKSQLPLLFTIGVNGLTEEKSSLFFSETKSCLKRIVSEGFLPNQVNAAIEKEEIGIREIGDQEGMRVADRIIDQWICGVDPLKIIDVNTTLKTLRAKLATNSRYFEDLILRVLINNDNRSELICRPKKEYSQARTDSFSQYLSEKRKAMSEAEVNETLERPQKIHLLAETPQPVHLFPCVKISDLRTVQPKVAHYSEGGVFVIPQPLNGLVYVKIIGKFPIISREIEKMPVLANLICNLGGNGISDIEFSRQEELYTSGILGFTDINANLKDSEKPEPYVSIGVHCLKKNFDNMLKLLRICLLCPDLKNKEKMRAVIEASANNIASYLSRGVFEYATDFSCKGLSRLCALQEMMSGGISELRIDRKILANFDEEVTKFEKLFNDVLCKAKFSICLHCNEGEQGDYVSKLKDFVSELNSRGTAESDYRYIDEYLSEEAKKQKILYEYSSKTNCSTIAFKIPEIRDFKEYGKYIVTSRILDNEFLAKEIRQKLGAYGFLSRISPLSGSGAISSYRDTCPIEVLEALRKIVTEMASGRFDDACLERSILVSFSKIDYPIPPASIGMEYFLFGLTWEQLQDRRTSFLNITKEDIIKTAERIKESRLNEVVIGNRNNFSVPSDFIIEMI